MKIVVWMDKDGFKRRSLLRDCDSDSDAPGGVPQNPPDLRALDYEGIARDLNNYFVDQGVASWSDLQQSRSLRAGIMFAMKRRVVSAFRELEVDDE